jgi:cytochrome c2
MRAGNLPAVLALGLAAAVARPAELPLQPARSSPFDLEVTGALVGVPAGAPRYVRYADLRALPAAQVRLAGEFGSGERELTVVFLSDLWSALPVAPEADCLLATCRDDYASIFRQDFIAADRPFLVVAIDGLAPARWSELPGGEDPGPYAIGVAPALAPAAAHYLSLEHKEPWGVVRLEFARYADRFHGAYAGRWAALSPRAEAGRELWINACASCHAGPGAIFSGTKSHQAFAILAAVARGDPALFRQYVRDPKSVSAGARMEAHAYFSDDQLNAVIAFVTAEPR